MTTAILCPRDNLFGILSADGASVGLRSPSSDRVRMRTAIANARQRFPDSVLVEVESEAEASSRLEEAAEQSRSLDFVLMLFDGELSFGVRRLAAEELASLLEAKANRDYVLDIVLAAPLHPSADVVVAMQIAADSSPLGECIRTIIRRQKLVRNAYDAWHRMRTHEMVTSDSRETIYAAMVRLGVFRRLVAECETQAAVEELFPHLVLNPELRKFCEPRILQAFTNEYKENLPKGQRVNEKKVNASEEIGDPAPIAGSARDWASAKSGKADDMAEWATRQVDSAADHFRNDRDALGRKFWRELVDAQTRGTADRRHVVKSLCNLSKQCTVMGRTDLGLEILTEAFGFRSGVDAVAYVQLGDEFFRLGQFDRASEFYKKARETERDPERIEQIRRKAIRIYGAQGLYHQAIAEFLAVPNHKERADMQTDIGTLERKLGNLSAARSYYWQAIKLDGLRHQPYAGLAEAKRQSGKLHQSLKSYNSLLNSWESIDFASEKVYRLAQCSLYRLTRQLERAKAELGALYDRSHHDDQVKRQYGRLLILSGDRDRGERLLGEIDLSNSLSLADELFIIAKGEQLSTHGGSTEVHGKAVDDYLPEERGLASCRHAFKAILDGAFEEAWQLVNAATHVDKLHRDFGFVLGFHAQKRLHPSLDFRSQQPLARLAKRGYPELRKSVLAIAAHDFGAAIQFERDMCLLVA